MDLLTQAISNLPQDLQEYEQALRLTQPDVVKYAPYSVHVQQQQNQYAQYGHQSTPQTQQQYSPPNLPPHLQHYWGIATGHKTVTEQQEIVEKYRQYEAPFLDAYNNAFVPSLMANAQYHYEREVRNYNQFVLNIPPPEPENGTVPIEERPPPQILPDPFWDSPIDPRIIPQRHVYSTLRSTDRIDSFARHDRLGSGQFGEVVRVTYDQNKLQENKHHVLSTETKYAMKEFPLPRFSVLNTAGFSITTMREVQTLQTLQRGRQHQNIVRLEGVVSSLTYHTENQFNIPFESQRATNGVPWMGNNKIAILYECLDYDLEKILHLLNPNNVPLDGIQAAFEQVRRVKCNNLRQLFMQQLGPSHGQDQEQRNEVINNAPAMQALTRANVWHLSLDHIQFWSKQLFSALCFLHDNDIIHRDIKPANILISSDGLTLKLADFGLARTIMPRQNDLTKMVSTLCYRSPEMLLNGTTHGNHFKTNWRAIYGVSSDVWAAGCVVAELLCGRPIFDGRHEVEQLFKIAQFCGARWFSAEYLNQKMWKDSRAMPIARMLLGETPPIPFLTRAQEDAKLEALKLQQQQMVHKTGYVSTALAQQAAALEKSHPLYEDVAIVHKIININKGIASYTSPITSPSFSATHSPYYGTQSNNSAMSSTKLNTNPSALSNNNSGGHYMNGTNQHGGSTSPQRNQPSPLPALPMLATLSGTSGANFDLQGNVNNVMEQRKKEPSLGQYLTTNMRTELRSHPKSRIMSYLVDLLLQVIPTARPTAETGREWFMNLDRFINYFNNQSRLIHNTVAAPQQQGQQQQQQQQRPKGSLNYLPELIPTIFYIHGPNNLTYTNHSGGHSKGELKCLGNDAYRTYHSQNFVLTMEARRIAYQRALDQAAQRKLMAQQNPQGVQQHQRFGQHQQQQQAQRIGNNNNNMMNNNMRRGVPPAQQPNTMNERDRNRNYGGNQQQQPQAQQIKKPAVTKVIIQEDDWGM